MKSIMQIRQIDDERIKELKHMKNIINKSYQQTNLYICIYIYSQYHENNKPQICK